MKKTIALLSLILVLMLSLSACSLEALMGADSEEELLEIMGMDNKSLATRAYEGAMEEYRELQELAAERPETLLPEYMTSLDGAIEKMTAVYEDLMSRDDVTEEEYNEFISLVRQTEMSLSMIQGMVK